MKISDLARCEARGWENVVRRLVRVDERDTTAKGVVDHVAKHAACGLILSAAMHLGKNGNNAAALAMALLFLMVLSLHTLHGLVLASAFGVPRWMAVPIALMLLFGLSHLAIGPALMLAGK